MKKQIFILSAIAFATTSANAYTILDNQNSGTKVDLTGSARLVWKSSSTKTTHANGDIEKEHINHAVANNGSRIGFKITQQLGAGIYGVGRVEWRFRGTAKSQHDFDDIYTRQLFAGIGHKKYGELVYGNLTTITDSVKQTDLGNTLSLSDGLLIGSARKVAQYTYSGSDELKGLKVGGFFGGKSKRNMNGLDLNNQRKDVWGLAAIHHYAIDDIQTIKLGAGITREHSYNNTSNSKFARTAYSLGGAYTFENTTIGLDLERARTKDQGTVGNRRLQEEVRTVLKQKLTNDWSAYTMYAYKTNKVSPVASQDSKVTKHQYMLGTEYYFIPKYVKGFAEVATSRAKNDVNGIRVSKSRDNIVAIGMRAYW